MLMDKARLKEDLQWLALGYTVRADGLFSWPLVNAIDSATQVSPLTAPCAQEQLSW